METLRHLAGRGWLRTGGLTASTAAYDLTVRRRKSGPRKGEILIAGRVESESWVFADNPSGRGMLTLEDGTSYPVRLSRRTSTEADFDVLPPFKALVPA